MIKSPLTLEMYFFTNIQMEAQAGAEDDSGQGALRTYLHSSRHEDDPRRWHVSLGVEQAEDKDGGCPLYTFRFEVSGLFSVDKGYPPEKTEQLIRVNGAAVLYGAIREMAANLSARGPYPPVNLPTVTFVDEAKPEASMAQNKPRIPTNQGRRTRKAQNAKE